MFHFRAASIFYRLAAMVVAASSCLQAGDVDFVPYYEPGSSWSSNASARTAAEGMFTQFEATLKTSGDWNSVIEVWLDDNEFVNYASATSGSFHNVNHYGLNGIATNPWVQIVKGMTNPNGVINGTTGANADLRVSWNFFMSEPQSNIGLLRHELMHGMGMCSNLNAKPTMAVAGAVSRPGIGNSTPASIHDLCLVDASGNSLLSNAGNEGVIANYAVDANWDDANGTGLRILGVKDMASGILDLPLSSYNSSGVRLTMNPAYAGGTHSGEVDPAHINMVSFVFAHPTWNTIAEVDRAWFRGVGYSVKGGPTTPPPLLSTPTAVVLQEDGPPAKVWFAVEDGQSAADTLTVQAVTAGGAPFSVAVDGVGAVRCVSISPLANRYGSSSVSLSVRDPQGNETQTSFSATIVGVNDPPVINPIAEVILPLGTASTSVGFSIQDSDHPVGDLVVTAVSSDQLLVPQAGLSHSGSGGQRTLLIQPNPGRIGECEVTLTASDGQLSASCSLRVAVVELVPGDDHAGSFAGATTLTAPLMERNGSLSPGDVDVFRFVSPGPGLLIAWTSGGTPTSGALFSSDGAELQRDQDNIGADFRISSRVYAGVYYIEVAGDGASTVGSYTLHLDFVPAGSPFALTSFSRSGDDVLLGFPGADETSYQIEWSDDLIRWTHCKTVEGNKRECYERLPDLGNAPRRFFRVYSGPILHPTLRLAKYYYPFDGDGLNARGGGGNFEMRNVTFSDGGLYCNGIYSAYSSGFSATATLPKIDFNGFAFSIRFKPEGTLNAPVLMVDSAYRALEVGVQSGKLLLRLNNSSTTHVFSSSTVKASDWNTVAGVIDTNGHLIRIVLNGSALADVTLASSFAWSLSPSPTTDLTFTNYGDTRCFKGWVDDLRIYPMVLTLQELLAIP